MEPSPIRVIALCCCILGGFFVVKSILIKTPKYVLHELLDFKVNKSRFFRKHIGQKLEAIIGGFFFFVGFLLLIYLEVEGLAEQAREAGTGGSGFTNWWAVIGVTTGVMVAIAVLLGRITRYFSGKIFVELVRFMVENHDYPLENDQSLLMELGRIMRVKRTEEDTVESYTNRVRAKMKIRSDAEPRVGDESLAY